MALDTLFQLKQLGKQFHYTIIGVKSNEALIFQRDQLGLDNEVSFVESLSFSEVKEVIQAADVMVLPSVEEGIANVVVEAMALGTLVISTNCGGMAELVLDGETGFLVPNRDVQAMTKALIELSEISLSDYQNITKQARAFVEQHHSEARMVEDMQNLYQHLIQDTL